MLPERKQADADTEALLAEDWMTPRQVGEVLNIDPETLRRWARKGEGPPFLQGAGYTRRYSRSGLAEWIANRYSPAKGDRAS